MPLTLTEAVTISNALREKRNIEKNTKIMIIGAIIHIITMLIGAIINVLGTTHNKPVINIMLLTMIGILILIKIMKPKIRMEHKLIIELIIGI